MTKPTKSKLRQVFSAAIKPTLIVGAASAGGALFAGTATSIFAIPVVMGCVFFGAASAAGSLLRDQEPKNEP